MSWLSKSLAAAREDERAVSLAREARALGAAAAREVLVEAEYKAPNRAEPVLNPFLTTTPVFPIGDYIVFSNQGYRRNELIYRGLNMLAGGVAEAPLRVYNADGEAIETHPIRALIKRPNPFMGEHLLWEITVLHKYLSGNAFWLKVFSRSGAVVELWPLRPDRMRIVPDNKLFVGGYVYEIGGRQYQLETGDIIHFKFPDPLFDYWGMSPLQAAMRRIAIDNELADFIKVTLQNFGVPMHYFTTPNAVDQATTDRVLEKIAQRFGGRERGKPGLLQAGMDVKSVAMNLDQMAFPELDDMSQKRVLTALGIPPVLLGQEATFANYETSKLSFYEDTVEPLHSRLDDRLEADLLFANFEGSDGLELHFDTSRVAAMRPVRAQRWKDAQAGVAGGWVMENEARAMVGLPPKPDGDVYLRPLSTIAVPGIGPDDLDEARDDDSGEEKSLARLVRLNPHLLVMPPAPSPGAQRADLSRNEAGEGLNTSPAQLRERRLAKRAVRVLTLPRTQLAAADIATVKKIVLHRSALADRYAPQFESWAKAEFRRESRDATRAIARRFKALSHDQLTQILEEMSVLEAAWEAASAKSVAPLMASIVQAAADDASRAELGVAFDLSNAQVLDFIRRYSYKFADQVAGTSASEVRALLTQAESEGWSVRELTSALENTYEGWDTLRAETIARAETIRAANAGAVESYRAAGITLKEWLADSGACPYCQGLDGRVIGIDENFLTVGQSYHPDGAERPMVVSYEDVGYPPAHPRCRCAVRAVVN